MLTLESLPTLAVVLLITLAQVMPLAAWGWCVVRSGRSTLADQGLLVASELSLAALLPQVRQHPCVAFLGAAIGLSLTLTAALAMIGFFHNRRIRHDAKPADAA